MGVIRGKLDNMGYHVTAEHGTVIWMILLHPRTAKPFILKCYGFQPYLYTNSTRSVADLNADVLLQMDAHRDMSYIPKMSKRVYNELRETKGMVLQAEVVSDHTLYLPDRNTDSDGYMDEPVEVRKISCVSPSVIPYLRGVLAAEGKHIMVAEADVDYCMRFRVDHKITMGNWVEVDEDMVEYVQFHDRTAIGNEYITPHEYLAWYGHVRDGGPCDMKSNKEHCDFETHGLDPLVEWTTVGGERVPTQALSVYVRYILKDPDSQDDSGEITEDFFLYCKGQTNHHVLPDGNVAMIACASEEDLLRTWVRMSLERGVTQIYTYNGRNFDMPFAARRAEKLGLHDLCFGYLKGVRPRVREKTAGSKQLGIRKAIDTTIPGRHNLDICEFLRTSVPLIAKYLLTDLKLKTVASRINGEDAQKIDLSFDEFPRLLRTLDGILEIGKYNRMDVVSQYEIWKKIGMESDLESRARTSNVSMEEIVTRGMVHRIKPAFLTVCKGANTLLVTRAKALRVRRFDGDENDNDENEEPTAEEQEKLAGATVLDSPPFGELDELMATLDFASLYPSIMTYINLCSTTKVTRATIEEHGWQEFKDYLRVVIDKDRGIEEYYVRDHIRMGILPAVVKFFLDGRQVAKDAMGAAEKKKLQADYLIEHFGQWEETKVKCERKIRIIQELLEHGNPDYNLRKALTKDLSDQQECVSWLTKPCATDLAELKAIYQESAKEQARQDARQNALKIAANSVYGASGGDTSPFYSMSVAASVTATGRWLIQTVAEVVTAKFSQKNGYPFDVKAKYGDTVENEVDSVFFHILLPPGSNLNARDMIEYGQEFASYANREIYRRLNGLPETVFDDDGIETEFVISPRDVKSMAIKLTFEKIFIRILFGRKKAKGKMEKLVLATVGTASLDSMLPAAGKRTREDDVFDVDDDDDDDDNDFDVDDDCFMDVDGGTASSCGAPPPKKRQRRGQTLGLDDLGHRYRCLKKRYVGLMWTDAEKPPEAKVRGMDDVRRETTEIVRDVMQLIYDRMVYGGQRKVVWKHYYRENKEEQMTEMLGKEKYVSTYDGKTLRHHFWHDSEPDLQARLRTMSDVIVREHKTAENFENGMCSQHRIYGMEPGVDTEEKLLCTQYFSGGKLQTHKSDKLPSSAVVARVDKESMHEEGGQRYCVFRFYDHDDRLLATQYYAVGMLEQWRSDFPPPRSWVTREEHEDLEPLDQLQTLLQELRTIVQLLRSDRLPLRKCQSTKGINKSIESYQEKRVGRSEQELRRTAIAASTGFGFLHKASGKQGAKFTAEKPVPGHVKLAIRDGNTEAGTKITFVYKRGVRDQPRSQLMETVERMQAARDRRRRRGTAVLSTDDDVLDMEFYAATIKARCHMLMEPMNVDPSVINAIFRPQQSVSGLWRARR